MPIILKEKVGPQVSAGTHIAVCYRIVHIGTQPDSGFGEKDKLLVFWEVPAETVKVDGTDKPMGISKFYNLGSSGGMNSKSELRKHLAAWRGRDFTDVELGHFELKAILGKACQITVEPDKGGRSKVTAVVGLAKGMQAPGVTNPLVDYSISEGKNEVYKALPEWVRKYCDQCLEWNPENRTSAPTSVAGDGFPPDDDADDPMPF